MDPAAKHRFVTTLQRYVVNPLTKPLSGIIPGTILLETTGRKSGERRRTPVGGRREGDTVWIVAEFGRRAAYVRNLEADPRVRLRINSRWHTGSATTIPGDDPFRRLDKIRGMNSRMVRLVGTDLLTVRVDLD